MKKFIIWLSILILSVGTAFWQFMPSQELEEKVEKVWTALIEIIEKKYASNYDLLISAIEWFKEKVRGNEEKTWIISALISQIEQRKEVTQAIDNAQMWIRQGCASTWEVINCIPEVGLTLVSAGKTIRWVSYSWQEEWIVWKDGMRIYATFYNLPDPEPDNFYEWRIVRPSPLDVISTWVVYKEWDVRVNDRTSDFNLDNHTKYVLTLEPNDDDPAPADHIFDGEIK